MCAAQLRKSSKVAGQRESERQRRETTGYEPFEQERGGVAGSNHAGSTPRILTGPVLLMNVPRVGRELLRTMSPILYEKGIKLKLSGNQVCYTNCLISLFKIMLCGKRHYQKV